MTHNCAATRSVEEKIAVATNDFIGARLPAWLRHASRGQMAALHAAFNAHQASQARLRGLTLKLEPLDVFAEKHLKSLLAKPLPKGVTFSQLEWLVVTPWVGTLGSSDMQQFGYRATRTSGILRLMSNFKADSSFYEGSGLVAPGHDDVLSISAAQFASECRKLDAGKHYQNELDQVFNSAALTILADDKRSGLALASKIAAMKGDISAAVEVALLEMTREDIHFQHSGLRAYGGTLKVLGQVAGDGMLVRLRDVESKQKGILLFLPGDPLQALRYFDDEASMNSAMATLLQDETYHSFFSQLISLGTRAEFVQLLGKRLKDPKPDLEMQGVVVSGSIFAALAIAQVKRTKDDARLLLVPTDEADARAARARHEAWKTAGLNLSNLAGLFIPVVGAVMLGQLVVQTLSDVFEGAQDWYEGHRHEALEHMLGVAEALAATTATVIGVSAVRSALVAAMEPVNVKSGVARLWHDNLMPYESVPENIVLRPDGLYGDGKQRWLRAGSRYYEVHRPDPDGPYRLRHQRRSGAYEPAVLHNDQRCWRPICERPWEWDDSSRMLDRLWPQHPMVGAQRAEQILSVAGVDQDELRGILMENRVLPVNLREALRSFDADEQIGRFFEHLQARRLDEQDEKLLAWCEALPDVDKGIEQVLAAKQQLRGQLYAHLTHLGPVGNEPLLKLLNRDFPGLGDAFARQLESEAGTVEHNEALRTGKLPLAVASKAASLLRVARISKALAGLYLASAYSTETGELIFALINQLGPQTININLCEGEFDGRFVASLVAQEQGTPRLALVYQDGQFNVFEVDGSKAAVTVRDPGDLFEVIAALLTSAQQAELGIEGDERVAQALRARALEQLPATHEQIARFLEWPDRERWMNPGHRLEDGRVGYLLSGRGAGQRRRSREVLRDGLRRYFPGLSEVQIDAELHRMLAGRESAYELLTALQDDHEQLERALQRWRGSELNDARRQIRGHVVQRLRRAWAAQAESMPANDHGVAGQRLTLTDLNITTLPEFPLKLDFTYITSLVVSGMAINEVPAQFLGSFTHLRALNMAGNALLRVPAGIAYLTELRELRLARNSIRLDAAAQQALTGLPRLTYLDMSQNPLGQFAMRFNHLPHLVRLYLRNCRLGTWPTGLELCGFLEVADLRDNQLPAAPDVLLQMPYEFRRVVQLDGNPMSSVAVKRFYALENVPEEPHELPRSAIAVREWWVGEDADAPTVRSHLWAAVQATEPGARLVALLGELIEFAGFSWSQSHLLERGWAVLSEWDSNTEFRQAVNALMEQPVADDNAAIDRFSQLSLRLRVARATGRVAVGSGTELLDLGRALMRLEFLDQHARREVARRVALRNPVDRTAIVLGYRVRLRQRLNLPEQPLAMRESQDGRISAEQLLAATRGLREIETDENLAASLCRRQFWQRYLALVNADAFNNLAQLYQQRRNLLAGQRAQLGEPEYQHHLVQLDDELDADTHALRLQLTLQAIRSLARSRG
ncbi:MULTISPECIES: NEL-type E3 ubiquitin ligase domain-containing protein [unclassified Pseudomonas]|uniref:NEL-type E3 ubiquitin ligase domain-containing protein n=1 Tax=unclassified Pseudomonas TaxID=196821 RepID=UPI000A1DF359|nr:MULTISPECIES: NEL-type E3 ubiquitin ligase domain-containing protein [unclassified Pseudomonas]